MIPIMLFSVILPVVWIMNSKTAGINVNVLLGFAFILVISLGIVIATIFFMFRHVENIDRLEDAIEEYNHEKINMMIIRSKYETLIEKTP